MRVSRTRHGLPLVATAFLVLLVLGAIGLVNGSWSEQLSINGTVTTAQIEVKWLPPVGSTCGDIDEKDLAETTRELVGEKFIIRVDNGFPGYKAKCNFRLENNGTLPFVIGQATIKPGVGLHNCGNDPTILDCDELSVEYNDGVGTELQPGDPAETSSVLINIKKGAMQETKYDFEIQVCVAINTKPLCGP